MSASSLIAAHLNASVGKIVQDADIENSLRNGCLTAKSEQAKSLLCSMFIEIDPRLIVTCALEVGSTIKKANLLYSETLKNGFPKCLQWEVAIEHLL